MSNKQEILKICGNNPAIWKNAWYNVSRKNKRHFLDSVPADFEAIKKEALKIRKNPEYAY